MQITLLILIAAAVGVTWVVAQEVLRQNFEKKRTIILKNIIEVLDRPEHTTMDTFTALQNAINDLKI